MSSDIRKLINIVTEATTSRPRRIGSRVSEILDANGIDTSYWNFSKGKTGYVWTTGTARGLGVDMPTDEAMKRAESQLRKEFGDGFVDLRAEVFLRRTTYQSAPIQFDPEKGRPKRTVLKVRFSHDIEYYTDLSLAQVSSGV